MNDQAAAPALSEFRAANFGGAARWIVLGALGFAAFYFRPHSFIGLAGGAVGLFAIQAALSFYAGVRVDDEGVTLPRPLFAPIPLLVLGRIKTIHPLMNDITAAGRFMGLDVVVVTTSDGAFPVLFGCRAKRLAFFEAVKSRKPDIKIYRAI